jgi:hypothetical protein
VLRPTAVEPVEALGDAEIDARIESRLREGSPTKVIATELARESGRPRREIYERVEGLRRRK